jgi:uncharacterized protein DUF29
MAEAVREGRWEDIDRDELAEEIDSLGRSERDKVRTRLRVILTHLLKQTYQPEKKTRSWSTSISTQRFDPRLDLDENPSLRRQLAELVEEAYQRARRSARDQTGLPLKAFPERCPWPVGEVIRDESEEAEQ